MGGSRWQDGKERAYRQLKQEEGEEAAVEPLNNKAWGAVKERLKPRRDDDEQRVIFHLISHPHRDLVPFSRDI